MILKLMCSSCKHWEPLEEQKLKRQGSCNHEKAPNCFFKRKWSSIDKDPDIEILFDEDFGCTNFRAKDHPLRYTII